MAEEGVFIRDVNSLVSLSQRMETSSREMASIDQDVMRYLREAESELREKLDYLKTKLDEAKAKTEKAEREMNSCHAKQTTIEVAEGVSVTLPSCSEQESDYHSAKDNEQDWQRKYDAGMNVLNDCLRDISEYQSGGQSLVREMCDNQTPKATADLQECMVKLQDILNADVGVSALGRAGGGGDEVALVGNNREISGFYTGSKDAQSAIIRQNRSDVAKALGVELGNPMTIGEADKQSANPNYTYEFSLDPNGDWFRYNGRWYNRKWDIPQEMIEDMQGKSLLRYSLPTDYKYEFGINCATTSAAYALRRGGVPLQAKGNPEKNDNLNTWLSHNQPFDIWNNADGTKATPILYRDWMKEQGYGIFKKLTPEDYKTFFEKACKEKGTYIVTTWWKDEGGHATILERDSDGKLYFIEPQVYQDYMTDGEGRRSIDDLVNRMHPNQIWSDNGVMRVDDKLFNLDFVDLFQK